MGNAGRKPRITDEELMEKLHDLTATHENPVVTTREVTEAVPLKRDSVYDRLQNLHEEGEVMKKKVGARGIVWWP